MYIIKNFIIASADHILMSDMVCAVPEDWLLLGSLIIDNKNEN